MRRIIICVFRKSKCDGDGFQIFIWSGEKWDVRVRRVSGVDKDQHEQYYQRKNDWQQKENRLSHQY